LGVTLRKNFGSGFPLQSFYLKKNKKDFHCNPLRNFMYRQLASCPFPKKTFANCCKKTTFAQTTQSVKMHCSASLRNNYTMKNTLIAPSVLAADFGNLQRDIEMINNSEADWFHIDIMDGVFVPNISYGMPVLEAINRHAKKTIDVHLMIVDPDRYIKTFAELGANILSVHYEACTHLHRTLQAIKAEGMKAGVAINPHTNIDLLEDVINDIDLVCIMSVNPGFGGQSFIENTYAKIEKLKALITRKGASTIIEVDGGVTNKNAKQLVEAGADVLVAGSFVFKAENPTETIADLKKLTSF
jgi:ribulose-phosphate 3-epimerase